MIFQMRNDTICSYTKQNYMSFITCYEKKKQILSIERVLESKLKASHRVGAPVGFAGFHPVRLQRQFTNYQQWPNIQIPNISFCR